jgi:hypothetical protein
MKQDIDLKSQVKKILKVVEELAPGKSVELRIPPYAAIQCVTGSTHRRGTPANVVEMSGQSLIKLSQNADLWDQLCSEGQISASGTNSNLSGLFTQVSKLISSFDKESSNGK